MDDQNVRNILGRVRNITMAGKSPIEYIDGVLDGIPQPRVHADLNASAYGVTGVSNTTKRPICGCCADQLATKAIYGGCADMGAEKALF